MACLRRLIRIPLLALWCLLLMIPAAVCVYSVSGWKRSRRGARWAQFWARGAVRILGIKLRLSGVIPETGGKLIVSNHLGYLDVLAHASVFAIRFAPKAEISNWFFFGWMTSLNDPVWIDRGMPRRSMEYSEKFRDTIRNGLAMLVYPEGTSTDGKHGLLPFKSTPFSAVLDTDSGILPTLLFYREIPASSPPGAWFGDISFGAHLWQVLGIKRIEINLFILPEEKIIPGENRKDLAERIHNIMEKEYWKIEKSFE